jgi:drug/metabolite transporter (DMT)-like permease
VRRVSTAFPLAKTAAIMPKLTPPSGAARMRAAVSQRPSPLSPASSRHDQGAKRQDRPLLGIGLILASTFFLSCSDVTSKYLTASLPAVEIAWLRYLGFVTIILGVAAAQGRKTNLRALRPGLQVMRGLGLVCASVLFVSSLRYLPIAEATAISFVSPVFITGLSVLVLGEAVGRGRWTAALVGFLGVMIIVRPGTAAFQPAAVLTLLSALSWAATVVLTRKMSGERPLVTLLYSAVVGLVVLTVLLPFNWTPPDWRQLLLGGFIGAASTVGHWIVVVAYRQADASVLAPFSYTQLVWAGLFGFVIFGTWPDRWTAAGAGVIILSGVYMAYAQRRPSQPRA